MKELLTQGFKFFDSPTPAKWDIRILAFNELIKMAESNPLQYRAAMQRLGQIFHLPRPVARSLILELCRLGFLTVNARGKILFNEKGDGDG